MKTNLLILLSAVLFSCSGNKDEQINTATLMGSDIEAISFAGKELKRKPASEALIHTNDSLLNILMVKSKLSEDDYIEAGRLHSAVNRYRAAIEVYTKGIQAYPSSFKLLRHRGHRYLSTRQPEKAIVDLRKGDELVGNDVSVLEYNTSGYATGSYKYWIWYHIGIYYLWNSEYTRAVDAFQNCLSMAIDSKNQVGSRCWLYETYQKLGQTDQANAVVMPITPNFDVDPEYSYFQKILLYKGLLAAESLVDLNKPTADWNGTNIARAYGVAFWHKINNRDDASLEVYQKILETPHWNTWAYAMTDYEVNVVLK